MRFSIESNLNFRNGVGIELLKCGDFAPDKIILLRDASEIFIAFVTVIGVQCI